MVYQSFKPPSMLQQLLRFISFHWLLKLPFCPILVASILHLFSLLHFSAFRQDSRRIFFGEFFFELLFKVISVFVGHSTFLASNSFVIEWTKQRNVFSHTIRKVKFLSKNLFLTKLQHFHEFFTQNFFGPFFSWNQSCQQLKSPKPQHFREFFTQKNRQFSWEIKVEFLNKKWRFWTVWLKYGSSVTNRKLF